MCALKLDPLFTPSEVGFLSVLKVSFWSLIFNTMVEFHCQLLKNSVKYETGKRER